MPTHYQIIATDENTFPEGFKFNNNIIMALL